MIKNKNIYFACLDIYHTPFTYDFNQKLDHVFFSDLALNVGTLFLNKYEIVEIMQEDSFGFTYLVKEISNDKQYFVKEFFPKKFVTRNNENNMIMKVSSDIEKLTIFNYMQNFFTREAHTLEKLSTLSHPNIIRTSHVINNINNTTYIFYPYYKGMSLRAYIERKERNGSKLNNQEMDKILYSLLDAVEHLHSLNIYHLNITLDNIFMREDGVLILLGFEASAFFYDQYSNVYCNGYTRCCAAPEQIDSELFSKINETSDIYAIGVLIYRIITGSFPPDAKKRMDYMTNQIQDSVCISLIKDYATSNEYSPFLLYSVDKALAFSPNDRFKDIKEFKYVLQEGPTELPKGLMQTKKSILMLLLFVVTIFFIVFIVSENNKNDEEINRTEIIVYEKKKEIDIKVEKKRLDIPHDIDQEENNTNLSHLTKEVNSIGDIEKKSIEEKNSEDIREINRTEIIVYEKKKEIDIKVEKKRLDIDEEENNTNLSHLTKEVNSIGDIEKKSIEENETILMYLVKKKKIVTKDVQSNTISKTKKSVKKVLKKRKKRLIKKKNKKKKTQIQVKKTSVRNSSSLVWYCKAIGGNIRSSARNSNKVRAKNIALSQCRKKAGSQKPCRILNCFLLR